jgi:hypothetical protein
VTQLLRRPFQARTPWLRRVLHTLLALACSGSAVLPTVVAAQPAQTGQLATARPASSSPQPDAQRVLLLRVGGSVRSPLAARSERALAGVLAELGFLVTSSPLPFDDAQLVAGCNGTLRECGSQVAKALESEHLAVAQLEDEAGANGATLWLYIFESGSGAVRDGAVQLPRAHDEPLEPGVRALAARVLGVARPAVAPAPVSQPISRAPAAERARAPAAEANDDRGPGAMRALGWTSVGTGGALLVAALATSLAAQDASQAYARSEVQSRDDADRALAHYERAQRRTDAANVLWGVGAGTVAAGAFMLLWQHFAAPPDQNLQRRSSRGGRGVRVAAMPGPAGVSLSLSSEL